MKKISVILILILATFLCVGCKKDTTEQEGEMFRFMFFEYMGTNTDISIFAKNQEEADLHKAAIQSIYKMYHELTDYYTPLSEESIYKTNVFMINQRPNETIELDKELYDILVEALELSTLTNGYFDISIGHIVKIWKDLTQQYLYEEIDEQEFNKTLQKIEAISLVDEPFEVWQSEDKYFIKIKDDVKLDLGAISKGYATQLVIEYFLEQEISFYSISGGSSSLGVGQNKNRETGLFHIGLAHPLISSTYGTVYVKENGITTSGDYVQYATFQGQRYHHIINPKTKMPSHYYHTVTIIGKNLGVLDAVSTALFSMAPDVFEAWIDMYQSELDIEIVRFNVDLTLTKFLNQTVFEEK